MLLSSVKQLLIIQDRDRKLRTLRNELKNVPLEKKALDSKSQGSTTALETAKQHSREIEIKRKDLENEVRTRRDRIGKYQTQKLDTRKNEEYQAYNHAIESLEKEIQALEDQELELMEATEQHKPVLAKAEADLQATKASVQRQVADLDAKSVALTAQLKELEEERAKLAADVDEDLLDTYQRLFEKKEGLAVAGLANESCQGCHVKSQAHIMHAIRAAKEIVHCLNCGRILYIEN